MRPRTNGRIEQELGLNKIIKLEVTNCDLLFLVFKSI